MLMTQISLFIFGSLVWLMLLLLSKIQLQIPAAYDPGEKTCTLHPGFCSQRVQAQTRGQGLHITPTAK